VKHYNASRLVLAAVTLVLSASAASAITIDMVTVGNPGNAPDTRYNPTGFGAVGYTYQIGKFEVTAGQYTAFLNAVAKADIHGLYNFLMSDVGGCKIERSGSFGAYTYSVPTDYADRPVNIISWGDATRFANWLSNGQPTGGENLSTTEDGSYFLNGATSNAALVAVTRKPNATWVIPSEDEWYKAAYYDPNRPGGAGYWDYATKSNTVPISEAPPGHAEPPGSANYYSASGFVDPLHYLTEVGAYTLSPSAYDTFDQGGNVNEWNEALISGSMGLTRGVRGGAFNDGFNLAADKRVYQSWPQFGYPASGFRVASVASIPEPSSIALLGVGAISLFAYACGRRRKQPA